MFNWGKSLSKIFWRLVGYPVEPESVSANLLYDKPTIVFESQTDSILIVSVQQGEEKIDAALTKELQEALNQLNQGSPFLQFTKKTAFEQPTAPKQPYGPEWFHMFVDVDEAPLDEKLKSDEYKETIQQFKHMAN